jgi:signal transduction histidine kinase
MTQSQELSDTASARELLTVAAHDLRNHLTPLQARLDLIRRRALREGQPEYLHDSEHAARSLERLRHLIADLLDVSRLERGLFGIAPRIVDVTGLVADTADAFDGDIPIEIPAHAPALACVDPDRIQQALQNLLSNAVHHSPDNGSVRIDVSLSSSDAQQWVLVRVSDQGPGIPAELQDRVFDCFATGPGSVGLGLGLYLARRIAVAHGGALRVDSMPGLGASFTLALPALLLEAQPHDAVPLGSAGR